MKDDFHEYINYRIAKSKESFNDAKLLAENGRWNSCVNRLYYACFYIISALLLKNNHRPLTHTGVKSLFNLNFVKTGIVQLEFGQLLGDLSDWRQKGNYGDMFDFDKESVESLFIPVSSLIETIEQLINSD